MPRLVLILTAVLVAFLLPASPAWAEWVWPLRGDVITPYRNGDDPYASGQHRGIDIAGEVGAAVVAATDGDVRFAGTAGSSGVTLSIRTADGRFDTSYLHLSSLAVHKGDRIATGQRVGTVGTTGVRSAEQPHLHFGVRDAASRTAYHDPLAFLPPAAEAPEQPRGAPAPQPAPAPLRPAPSPVRVPAGRRVPGGGRAPASRRVPAGRPVPVDRRVPAAHPAPDPHAAPIARPAPAPAIAPRTAPTRAPLPLGDAPHASPDPTAYEHGVGRVSNHLAGRDRRLSGDPGPMASPSHIAGGNRSPSYHDAGRRGGGPDLGWALACVGLLLAAALLGLSEDGREATRRGRDRVTGLLRPLLGRH